MKIVLAQGNPGSNYATTRHNIGWILLDTFANGVPFKVHSKFFAAIAETTIAGKKTLLVKPTTYYNETGRSARALLDFYKLEPSDLLVIHDDLALPLGTIRIRQKGSDAGNNGIKSLNTHIGQDYWRMRVGIWNEQRDNQHDANFVLSTFSRDDANVIATHIAPETRQLVEQFCVGSLSHTSKVITAEK